MKRILPSDQTKLPPRHEAASGYRSHTPGWVFASVVVLTALAFFFKPFIATAPQDLGGIAFSSMQWHVRLGKTPAQFRADELQRTLQQRLDALDAILSGWRADSELEQLNRAAVGSPITVSDILFDAIEKANGVSELTAGAYDITVAPLVDLWGFGPRSSGEKIPDDDEIHRALTHVGWQRLVLDRNHKTVTRTADVKIDLSSVGEGVACDELAKLLEQAGVTDYTLAVAGAVRAHGLRSDGTPWQIAVEKPDASGGAQRVLRVRDITVVSAGSYRNYREHDGIRYSHIIDARNGRPITHNGVEVTVITPGSAMQAAYTDALATAFEALGPVEGFALAEQRDIAVLFIEKTPRGFVEHPTSAFAALVGKEQ